MDYLIPICCGLLTLTFALWVGYPMMRSRQQTLLTNATDQRDQLLERKEQLYAGLKELEFDAELGKLPAEEARALRQPLEAEAIEILRQLDQFNGRVDEGALFARIEADLAALRQETAAKCGQCGAPQRPDDRFCPQCGGALEGGEQS